MESYGEYIIRGKAKRYYNSSLIQNSKDAYLIGYLSCDGGFVKNRGFPFMMVSSTEEYIVRDFQKDYCPDNTIYFVGKKSSRKVRAVSDVWELRFPPKMSELWNNYGIFRYKKDRRLVGISNKYFLPYFAGVLEADGFIGVTHRRDCRTPRLRFFITHASELFLSDLQSKLEKFGVTTTLRQHGLNVFRLQAQNTEHNKKFLPTVLPFMRNYKKISILNNYLNKYCVLQEPGELLESESQSAAKPPIGGRFRDYLNTGSSARTDSKVVGKI